MRITVEFRGIELLVMGEHIPEEKEIRYDSDMGGSPGKDEDFDVHKIYIESTEVTDLLEEHLEEIEKLVLEQINEL